MTRETPVVKQRHDFSVGAGIIGMQTLYKGPYVREEKKPNAAFGAFRFGITDEIEVMASGSAFLFAGSSFELRGKWRWFRQNKWMVASSAFYTTDNDTSQGSSITYTTNGEGISTSLGYVYTPALTGYAGGKLMQMDFRSRDVFTTRTVEKTTTATVGAVFAGVTYQYFVFGVPYDTDFMLSVAMLPKELGNNSLTPYPMATLSVWWRH